MKLVQQQRQSNRRHTSTYLLKSEFKCEGAMRTVTSTPTISWLSFVALCANVSKEGETTKNMFRAIQRFTIGAVAIGTGVYSCCFVVHPGEAAVLYNKFTGLRDAVYGEGLHFRVLGIDDIKLFDMRIRPRVLQTMTGTKDLQMVNIRLRVLFRPEATRLPQLYRTFGLDYDERILPSISNEILKAVVAEYKAEELVHKRDAVSARIFQLMTEKVSSFGLTLEDLSLVDIQFGKEFMAAVEQKQVAQQEAEKMRFVVMENEQKKLAAIVRAQGEAESARLISKAIAESGKGLVELRRIDAAVEIANDLTASTNVHFVPSGGNMLLNLQQQQQQQQQQQLSRH